MKDQADPLKALEPEQGYRVPVVEATKPAQQKGDDAPGLLAVSPRDKWQSAGPPDPGLSDS